MFDRGSKAGQSIDELREFGIRKVMGFQRTKQISIAVHG